MSRRLLWFLSLLFTVLAMMPAFAHLLELPNKLQLTRDEYMTVQQIYSGWALVGIFIFGAMLSNLVLGLVIRRSRKQFRLVLTAFLCIVATQVVFWTVTYPANTLTENWTVVPDDWVKVRNLWEYSHGVSALFNITAVIALILAVTAKTPREELDHGRGL